MPACESPPLSLPHVCLSHEGHIGFGLHQVPMTNTERFRRHLTDNAICQVCKGGDESIIHILRDCPAMVGVWQRLIPQRKRTSFFGQTLIEWLYDNLGDNTQIWGSYWSTVFAIAVWWVWKWKCRDRVQFIKDLAKEVYTVHIQMARNMKPPGEKVQRLVGWAKPEAGRVKLNTDGASRGNLGLATVGGVLRDESGHWRGGFALNIGRCSTLLAELWGVYYGLYIAWEQRITQVELEVDSEAVVDFLKTGINDSHLLSFLVRLCHDFITRD